ncbi:YbaB/EbfC family nucleoid-associated protein [Sanguibacter antarcticus]|uniref:YbaB/EbfC DNA-binding family protein n=1 Tax=Sanguibacter antarcticus TaxID=372484 RepID=A0A2A9E5U3_9MICO|nr:YbaB/EbfC family nucleoid-associated protein [Sanguibacter antarcticus]PFG34427.1 hypothetical protein ATL42_2337 [Sanguibacter antarcticus]
MTTGSEAYLAAQQQIASWVEQAQRQEAAAYAVQSRIEALTVDRWSPHRELRVVVDHAGMLADVEITERALGLGPHALSRVLMDTLRGARATLREAAIAAAVEVEGRDSPLARSLSQEYRTTLGADGPAPDAPEDHPTL